MSSRAYNSSTDAPVAVISWVRSLLNTYCPCRAQLLSLILKLCIDKAVGESISLQFVQSERSCFTKSFLHESEIRMIMVHPKKNKCFIVVSFKGCSFN